MVDTEQSFIHHGCGFVIEAAGWPDEQSASAAIIDLQLWAMQFDPEETAQLHSALEQERAALVMEEPYDRDAQPLSAVRDAQRQAAKAGLAGRSCGGGWPTVTIEAFQVSAT